MMRANVASIAFALASFVGCGSNTPGTSAPPTDASSPVDAPTDAEIVDAPLDVTPPPSDASDAPSPPELPDASHWCDTQLFIFCDDFDEYALAQGWQGVDQQSASLALDDAAYVTPAYSFLASAGAIPVGGVALGRLQKRVADLVNTLAFGFEIRADALDPSGAGTIAATIQLADAAGTSIDTINLTLRASGATIDDVGPSGDGGAQFAASYPLAWIPSASAWTRIEIDLALPADAGLGAGTVTAFVGGASPPAVDHAPMSPVSQPAVPFLFLGAGVKGPSAPVAVHFDNVTLDYAD